MHKALLTLFALIICNLSMGQTEKSTTFLGVSSNFGAGGTASSLSFSSTKFKSDDFESESSKAFDFNLSTRIGTFLADDFVFGLDLAFATGSRNEGNNNFNQFLAGPFARYYFKSNKIRPFVEGNLSFGSTKNEFQFDTINGFEDSAISKSSSLSYGGGFGVAFLLGNKVSFNTMLGYTQFSSKRKEDNPDNSRSIINAIGLRLGFSIYLGSNQKQDLEE